MTHICLPCLETRDQGLNYPEQGRGWHENPEGRTLFRGPQGTGRTGLKRTLKVTFNRPTSKLPQKKKHFLIAFPESSTDCPRKAPVGGSVSHTHTQKAVSEVGLGFQVLERLTCRKGAFLPSPAEPRLKEDTAFPPDTRTMRPV